MSKPGRSDVLVGSAAAALLLVCCGAPLLVAGVVTAVASAGLIAQGAVLVGVAGVGLAAALGARYLVRRSATRRAQRPCVECAARLAGRQEHLRHAVPPPA